MNTGLEGTVVSIIYRSADGYTVLEVDGDTPTVAVGDMPNIKPGERARFFGAFREHAQYGEQFRVSSYESSLPIDINDMTLFLGGGFIKGLGERLAARIVEQFGEETFSVIEADPIRLADVKGISKRLAREIHEAFAEYSGQKEEYSRLMGMGLTAAQAVAAAQALGAGAWKIVEENPYELVGLVRGVDFMTADRIAQNLGITESNPLRIRSALLHILKKSLNEKGHTNVPEHMLENTAVKRLQVDAADVSAAIHSLCADGHAVRTEAGAETRVALAYAAQAEDECAFHIMRLKRTGSALPSSKVQDRLQRAHDGHNLAREQLLALEACTQGGVTLITGGPGTGKTTILKILTGLFDSMGVSYAMCAPTGRAAKRMEQSCGQPAATIHRLLEYMYDDENEVCAFRKDEDHPIDARAVIVDEVSMVDIFLLRSLLRAMCSGTRLILVGDADQLPSVGAGQVMADLIASGAVPVIRLTTIFRSEADIAAAAHQILRGALPAVCEGFEMVERNTDEEILSALIEEYQKYTDAGLEVQMLSPVKDHVCGTRNLNNMLRERVNPLAASGQQVALGDTVFRLHDRVMQMKNNYTKEWTAAYGKGEGIFNGDIGVITRIAAGSVHVDFDGKLCAYSAAELAELAPAYAYTVHKSQGNEFDVVVMPSKFPPTPFFSRNLLYTAVTRARKKVILVGQTATLRHMVTNDAPTARYTSLSRKLAELNDILFGDWDEQQDI